MGRTHWLRAWLATFSFLPLTNLYDDGPLTPTNCTLLNKGFRTLYNTAPCWQLGDFGDLRAAIYGYDTRSLDQYYHCDHVCRNDMERWRMLVCSDCV